MKWEPGQLFESVRSKAWVGPLLIFVFAVSVRLVALHMAVEKGLTHQGDEGKYFVRARAFSALLEEFQARGSLPRSLMLGVYGVDDRSFPPLAPVLVGLSMHLVGENEYATRIPSVLFSSLSVLLVYQLGLWCGRKHVAFVVALSYCVLPLSLYYALSLYAESVYAFLAMAVLLVGRRLVESSSRYECFSWSVIVGGILGMAGLARGAGLSLFVAVTVAVLLLVRPVAWKAGSLAVITSSFLLTISPWILALAIVEERVVVLTFESEAVLVIGNSSPRLDYWEARERIEAAARAWEKSEAAAARRLVIEHLSELGPKAVVFRSLSRLKDLMPPDINLERGLTRLNFGPLNPGAVAGLLIYQRLSFLLFVPLILGALSVSSMESRLKVLAGCLGVFSFILPIMTHSSTRYVAPTWLCLFPFIVFSLRDLGDRRLRLRMGWTVGLILLLYTVLIFQPMIAMSGRYLSVGNSFLNWSIELTTRDRFEVIMEREIVRSAVALRVEGKGCSIAEGGGKGVQRMALAPVPARRNVFVTCRGRKGEVGLARLWLSMGGQEEILLDAFEPRHFGKWLPRVPKGMRIGWRSFT